MDGGGKRRGRGIKATTTTPCIPRRFKTSRNAAATPASLLERFREVVFRLIMFSAISKGAASRTSVSSHADASPVSTARPCRHQDSYRSEAVEDCIEFLKRSAGKCPGDADGAKRSSASQETEDDVDSFGVLPLSPVSVVGM